jgi:hypothetical protein
VRFPRLHFPDYKFTIRPAGKDGDSVKIFDIIRRKYVTLTPEEWVRQHLLHFLLDDRAYPKGLVAVEKSLKVGPLDKRFDLLVYDRNHRPVLLAECKAPGVALDQPVFDQAARYNLTLRVPYLLITNGLETRLCRVDKDRKVLVPLPDLPGHHEL